MNHVTIGLDENLSLVRCQIITVYPKKYAHGFVVLCFVVVMQSFIMNSHEVFIHIHQGCFAGTVAIVRLPQCQWSKPDGYGKISQCITTTKHSKAKTVCIFLGIYCIWTNAELLLIGSMLKNQWNLNKNKTFPSKRSYLKRSSVKWRPLSLGINVWQGPPRVITMHAGRQPISLSCSWTDTAETNTTRFKQKRICGWQFQMIENSLIFI